MQWYSRWCASSLIGPAGQQATSGRDVPTLHVDGISYFELNDEGKIYRHTIEKLLINGVDAEPPYFGLFDVRQWLTVPGSLQPQGVVAPFPYHSDNPHAALDLN